MKPLTVLELKDVLRDLEDDDLVFIRDDMGYLHRPALYDTTVYRAGHEYTEFDPKVVGQKMANALLLD